MTEWRTVTEAPQYEVSNTGLIRSIYTNRPLTGGLDKDGYQKLVLCTPAGRIHRRVSALVCEAFHGPRPEGAVTRHKDGSRTNNHADNLEWGSQRENIADKRRHGTHQQGEKHGMAKLTADGVRDIRSSSQPCKALAEKYGISVSRVKALRSGRGWKHVE